MFSTVLWMFVVLHSIYSACSCLSSLFYSEHMFLRALHVAVLAALLTKAFGGYALATKLSAEFLVKCAAKVV